MNLFEIIESYKDGFPSVCAVYVACDLNDPVGWTPDYISFDANINGLNSEDYTSDVPSSPASVPAFPRLKHVIAFSTSDDVISIFSSSNIGSSLF